MMSTLENDFLLNGNEVNNEKLDELTSFSCEELQDLFSAKGIVCIHFENLDGSLVSVNNKAGIGCPGIKLSEDGKMLCGGTI